MTCYEDARDASPSPRGLSSWAALLDGTQCHTYLRKKRGAPLAEEIGPRADTIHSGAGDGSGQGFLAGIKATEGAAMPGQPS